VSLAKKGGSGFVLKGISSSTAMKCVASLDVEFDVKG
jgi:hypothetical protein